MPRDRAEFIFYGGNIITMDEKNPSRVEAVAISGQRIMNVGNIEDVFRHKGNKTEVIYLKGEQTLMPGFIEPHEHAILTAQVQSQYINISALNYRSYEEIREIIEKTMKELANVPGNKKWGLFFAWDPELIPDLPTLGAAYLDEHFPKDVAMAVVSQSGHVAWVNSRALKVANVDNNTPNPSGGTYVRDEEGNLTGQLLEEPAILGVIGKAPLPSVQEIIASVVGQWEYYASVGFTTVTELAYIPNPFFDELLTNIADREGCPIRLALYRLTHAIEEGGESKLRTQSCTVSPQSSCCPRFTSYGATSNMGLQSRPQWDGVGNYSSKLWEAGTKIIADGSPHSGTAAISEPYLNTPLTETLGFPKAPGYGKLNYDKKALCDTVKKYNQQGKQLAIHCHGERAVEQVLKAYEEVLAKCPGDIRHRMEHLGLMTSEQIARAGKINLALSFFVDHLRFYAMTYKTDIFGDRVNRWTPLSEATKSGVTWTIHQDHPTFPGHATPFSSMKTAVTRCTRDDPNTPYGPEYRVSIHEALKAYTINAAWQLHREDDIGSITIGKKADLVVLSENPYDVDPFELERIQVMETFLDGRRNKLSKLKDIPKTDIQFLYRCTNA